MILGAEFHRQIWQRFSLFSLLLMPVCVGLALLFSYMFYAIEMQARLAVGTGIVPEYMPEHWSVGVVPVSIAVVFFILFFYGTFEAASSFVSEQKNKTWDLPKTSAIRPIHLIIGKLFGATSGSWYFSSGFLLIGLYGFSHITSLVKVGIDPQYVIGMSELFLTGLTVVFSAFIGHLFALTGSLNNLVNKRSDPFVPFIVGIVGAYASFCILGDIFSLSFISHTIGISGHTLWYGMKIPVESFYLCSMVFFISCAGVSLHRSARSALSFQSYPFVLIIFYLLLCAYIAGFFYDVKETNSFLIFYAIFLVVTFSYLLHDAMDVGAYLRFFAAFKKKKTKRILETVPRWIPLGILAVFFLIGTLFSPLNLQQSAGSVFAFYNVCIGLFLFMIRDALVIHAISLGNRYRRAGLMRWLYFIFVYYIIPALVFMIAAPEGKTGNGGNLFIDVFASAEDYGYVLGVFFPSAQASSFSALLPVLLEIGAAGWILWRVCAGYRKKIKGAEQK